ncbi:hypothetical protein [Halioxenophilus aromaticivorans]|uniref:Uncharacterized protein n=1 Tax=Halioxenophilus aromaticivorans TaxID=1306992 RepID=A0AAV3U1C2_9ALTE
MKNLSTTRPHGYLHRTLVLGACLVAAQWGQARDVNLWLPGRYKQYMPQLENAVAKVGAEESCQKVVRGELMESQSKAEQPVFRIICRDDNLKTYATLMNGLSLEVLHSSGETHIEQKKRHLPHYARVCLKDLKAKAERLRKPRFPEGAGLKPTLFTGQRVEFEVDFSSQSLSGNDLEYRGYCAFEDMANYETEIRPRPKTTNTEPESAP